MKILIKSEADSRMFLYPLLRALYPYGSICVLSNNIALYRLLSDDDGSLSFRNIRIIVDPNSDVEELEKLEDLYEDKYDFIIYDNMDIPDYDEMFILLTNRITESYLHDILYIIGLNNTHLLRYGTPPKKEKPEKSHDKKPRPSHKPDAKVEQSTGESEDAEDTEDALQSILQEDNSAVKETGYNADGTFVNKWRIEKTDAEILNDKIKEAGVSVLPYPSFADIEEMESMYILPSLNDKQAKIYYALLKDYIGVEERYFQKGVKTHDQGGSFISGALIG